jgi:hypothetical protein
MSDDIRTLVPTGKDTIRSRIINNMIAVLKAAPFDEAYPDGPKLFDTVRMGVIDDLQARETPACAVEEGTERVTELIYEKTDKRLRVFFNIKVIKVIGLDATPVINYYFARIAKLFVTTTTHFADLTMDICEAGNSIQANGSTDPEPGGIFYVDVDYRHARGDMINE